MTDSQKFLTDYVQTGSEAAFRELVARYVDLVYSTALRLVNGDTHRAEDVAQTVFVDLARTGRRLPNNVMIGGWLHRHTCFVAANTMRGERRRQSRERQAVEMNAMQDNSGGDFSQVAPILDDAINELDEADRTAVLLRFYEQRDFRSVGEALGSNEDAARMRVNRALEKLESLLKRRGVSTSAAVLAMGLSASAVHAAPVGLAVTISTAAATTIAGTAAATTSTAIAMTTLQKTIITATLTVLAGAGIYEARQASQLRDQNKTFQQQQAPLTEQIQTLQRERDENARQLAALREDNDRLKSAQKQAEVLKLRGQVGVLRQQMATEAKNAASASGFSKMMSDPAMREYIHQAMVDLVKRRYSALFQELKLSPDQIDKFIQVVSDHFEKGAQRLAASQQPGGAPSNSMEQSTDGNAELAEKLKPVLGETAMARFGEFNQEIPARTTVDLLNTQLGVNKLNDAQSAQLLRLVKSEPFELTHGISGDLDKAFFGSQQDIDNHLAKVAESNQHVIQQAGSFLNTEQLAALNTVLSNGITARITQGSAFMQKR